MKKSILLIILIIFSSSSIAQIRKWVDENGNIHYGSKVPTGTQSTSIIEDVSSSFDTNPLSLEPLEPVIFYSKRLCDDCKDAKAYLKRNAIVYREYDIEKSVSAKYDYEKSGGRGLPFLVRGDDVLSGFTEQGYDIFFDNNRN